MLPEQDGDARYDVALACAYVCLHAIQSSPGATEAELLSVFTDAILEAIYCVTDSYLEAQGAGGLPEPSAN